jgi:hypothetical protein
MAAALADCAKQPAKIIFRHETSSHTQLTTLSINRVFDNEPITESAAESDYASAHYCPGTDFRSI